VTSTPPDSHSDGNRSAWLAWIGLTLGLTMIASGVLAYWQMTELAMAAQPGPPPQPLAFCLASIVLPLLRMTGNTSPHPAAIVNSAHYVSLASVLIGFVVGLLAARLLFGRRT